MSRENNMRRHLQDEYWLIDGYSYLCGKKRVRVNAYIDCIGNRAFKRVAAADHVKYMFYLDWRPLTKGYRVCQAQSESEVLRETQCYR